MWDLIVSVPDHCLSFYFPIAFYKSNYKSTNTSSASHLKTQNVCSLFQAGVQ